MNGGPQRLVDCQETLCCKNGTIHNLPTIHLFHNENTKHHLVSVRDDINIDDDDDDDDEHC